METTGRVESKETRWVELRHIYEITNTDTVNVLVGKTEMYSLSLLPPPSGYDGLPWDAWAEGEPCVHLGTTSNACPSFFLIITKVVLQCPLFVWLLT